ncbi:MAG TPA: HAMP domain-containing sensor histidine kinase [Azospirillaceae bacterium]|nr:HAMP domain-containing sensor histidine kinase [Azospirillaceae bacterium]
MIQPGTGMRIGRWLTRSLASRLVLLSLVFIAVPMLIYEQFKDADHEKQALLLRSAQQQGQLVARALQPQLENATGAILPGLGEQLSRFADEHTRVRLLLRPNGADPVQDRGFFYVASAPAVPTEMLDLERQHLMDQGVLLRLAGSCAGDQPLAIPVPTRQGGLELLTSITPINTRFGCWAVVTSHAAEGYLGATAGRPYWKTPEVQAAALVYLAMAALVLVLFLEVWRNLRRFGDLARDIVNRRGPAGSFAQQNTMPELAYVAEDFDRLVATLHNSASNLRRAAEDNAHAFKTPIAVIRQAVEPLKRLIPPEEARGRRAIDMIEGSVERLDGLVSFARRMDETTADLLEPPRQRIDLSALLERVLEGYRGLLSERGLALATRIEPGLVVRAGEDLLETVIENIVDNAISFSPRDGMLRVTLRRDQGRSVLVVEDEGPGVDPASLERIFERYFSQRPASLPSPRRDEGQGSEGGRGPIGDSMPHYGIGLWIVRRNVEAVGGRVEAANREEGGLAVTIALPAA